jgi:hypothetical protein
MQSGGLFPLTPTLVASPKLFTGGEESLWNLSPQPTVNNFAAHAMPTVNKLDFGANGSTVTPGWEDEFPDPYVATSWERLSLPARRLGSKRILKMSTDDVSPTRTSPSPSQRAGLANN